MTITQTIVREHEADLVVREARQVADGVVAIILAAPDGAELPAWTPGAHIDFVLGDDLIRQYSLCSSPSQPEAWRVGVLRAPDSRGGSEQVHDLLAPGSIVRVRGPRNHFPLVASSRYLFIAGGIGITPVLPMIAEADAAGADWRLFYGGRERASMAFISRTRSVWRSGDHRSAGRAGNARSGIRPRHAPTTTHWSTAAAPRVCSLQSRSSVKSGHRAPFTWNGLARSRRNRRQRWIRRSSWCCNAPV